MELKNIQAPTHLAPYAEALSLTFKLPNFKTDYPRSRYVQDESFGHPQGQGQGRFILLYDPSAPESWQGTFRVVCFAQAPIEADIGVDPFVTEVAWSWLTEALENRGAHYHSASGTASKAISTGFGELTQQSDSAQIEVRASWSPNDADLSPHVEAWMDLVSFCAGVPVEQEHSNNVSVLRALR